MHGAEQATAEDSGDSQHVEGVHQDVVLGLEHEHEVEGSRDAEGHAVGEAALSDGIDQQNRSCSSQRCAVGDTDPGAHTEAVAQFPLATHVAKNAQQEV